MAHLQKIAFHKLQNVAPGTELSFGAKGAVLLGKNGTGKTTLLNAIAAALHCDFDSLPGSFDIELTFVSGKDVISARLQAEEEQLPSPTSEEAANRPRTAHGSRRSMRRAETLLIEAPDEGLERVQIRVQDGIGTYRSARVTLPPTRMPHSWAALIFAAPPSGTELAQARRLSQLRMRLLDLHQLTLNSFRFDESLDAFGRITSLHPLEVVQARATIWYLNQLLSSPEGFVGTDTRQALVQRFDPEASHLTVRDTGLLHHLCELCGFSGASLTARLDSRRPDASLTGQSMETFEYAPFSFTFSRGGSTFSHDALSYGQKRLLSFLWYLEANPAFVIADELVNGMHHDWLSHCMNELQTRQSFLSSQNPLLFDFLSFESAEDVQRQFVLCTLDEEGCFHWQNMSAEDSVDFYESYCVGIQHVGEILRTKGYW